MKDWFLMLGILALCLLFLFNGCLMVLSPRRHIRFLDWLSRADKWSSANTRWKPGLDWGRRLAGLAFVLLALAVMKPLVLWMLDPTRLGIVAAVPALLRKRRTDWFGFASGVIILGAGVYILAQPRGIVDWVVRKNPQRVFQAEPLSTEVWRIRVFAALMIGVGVIAAIDSLAVS
jgi:hypothetical protein